MDETNTRTNETDATTNQPDYSDRITEVKADGNEPGKRRRGRPKGSTNKAKSISNGFTGSTEIKTGTGEIRGTAESGNREGKTETATVNQTFKTTKVKKPKEEPAKFMSANDAMNVSSFVLSMVEGFSVSTFGEEARFTEMEKYLLGTSLPQLLTTLELKTVENVTKVLYPLGVLAGFGSYGMRLVVLAANKSKEENKKKQVKVNQSLNGTSTEEPIQEDDLWTKTVDLTPNIRTI